MEPTWTAETCLARACRLMVMADEATSYDTILTYESLAREWIVMAGRCSRDTGHPTTPRHPYAAPTPERRRRFWFRRS